MNWAEAWKLKRSSPAKNCMDALPVVLEATSHRKPPPDAPSTIMCQEKVKKGEKKDNDLCFIIDQSYCPKGFNR